MKKMMMACIAAMSMGMSSNAFAAATVAETPDTYETETTRAVGNNEISTQVHFK